MEHITQLSPAGAGDTKVRADDVVMKYRYDIKGQLLEVRDPLDRRCFTHKYDTAGNNLWTEHLDSGVKTLVVDAQGKPLYSEDAKEARVYTGYDVLNRPTDIWARDAAAEAVTLRQHMVYGDAAHPDPLPGNHLGKLWKHYDEAGLATITTYDFKGNPLEKVRQVVADTELTGQEKYVVDWTGLAVPLETKEYVTSLLYDGLNRVRKSIYPEDVESARKELIPTYNRAGALQAIEFDKVNYVRHIAYNAKGQRVLLAMGNGMMTRYAYDPVTYRLQRIKTEGYAESASTYTPQSGSTKQDSAYAYDLGGNILKIQERVSDCGISGSVLGVDALDRTFQYDPLKRLLQATGRESDTQSNGAFWDEKPIPGSPNANHTRAYTQSFHYDKVGNILQLAHQATGNAYTRHYRYTSGQNLLVQLDDDGSPTTVYATFTYDANGNQVTCNTDRFYAWDAADQLKFFKIDAGGGPSIAVHYLYAGGNRVKKLVRNQSGGLTITVYIDGVYEHVYTKDSGGNVEEEQNILHVMDGRSRIATVRLGDDMDDPGPAVKYNLEDHLGTSTTRLDANGTLIDREEYYPFGDSSLRTFEKKRYRYVGKELDGESGLYYYGARYYAAWVGRFVSVDPLAKEYAQLTPYNYAANDPIGDLDVDGMQNTQTAKTPDAQASSNSMSPQNMELRRPIVLGTQQGSSTTTAPAAPASSTSRTTDTLGPADYARGYAVLHGFASPINTSTPQAVLRQADKPLATSIKEGLGMLSLLGREGKVLEFVGLMAYGTVEEASIFFQSWGVGTPRDLEGMHVGATQRQDAFFNTAIGAMGPLAKGKVAAGAADDLLQSAGGKADDFVTLYRGDQAGVKIIKSNAAKEFGYSKASDLIENGDLSELMRSHASSSSIPPSPFISATTDPNVARFFAGPNGIVHELRVPVNRAIKNIYNNMLVPAGPKGNLIPEAEYLIPNYIRPSEIIQKF